MLRQIKKMKERKKVLYTMGIILLVVFSFWIGRGSRGPSAGHDQEQSGLKQKSEIRETTWTCSMHPQIRRKEPGKCPICFMDLIPVSGSEEEDDQDRTILSMSENAKILADIKTAEAKRQSASVRIKMSGKVDFDETRVEMITARVGGRIDRLYVDYTGVPVKKGDHLARIYSPELVSLQKELIEAKQAVERSKSKEGSSMIENSSRRTLESAKEKFRLLGFKEWELEKILSRSEPARHMVIRAHQKGVVIKKLVEEGSYVKTGTPLFHIADLTQVWVKLDAYEADLSWLRLGQKVVFSAGAYPGEEFSGTISFIEPTVDPGTRTVKVRVIVDNKELRLKPDMFVKAVVKAETSKSGNVKNSRLEGKWISPMHPQVVKDHPGTCDICGMPLVKAEELGYVTSGFEDVDPLLIPATAPLITGERAVVYIELPDRDRPTYEGREVKLGPRVGDYYIVKSGLAPGERVVVNGAFKIDGELQIRAKPSMMSPPSRDSKQETGAGQLISGLENIKIEVVEPQEVSGEFSQKLSDVFGLYFRLSNALEKDNLEEAVKIFQKLDNTVSSFPGHKGKEYRLWHKISSRLEKELMHVKHVKSLSDARTMFENVSKLLITAEKQYVKILNEKHYLAFCPMAFNNQGAYWLQKDSTISNPYYGPEMLKCGEIKEVFKMKQE